MRINAMAAVALAACLSIGCLSNSYTIPKKDLTQLAQTNPEQRGEQVRIIQRFGTSNNPPEQQPVTSNTTIIIVGDLGPNRRRHYQGGGTRGGAGVGTSGGGVKKGSSGGAAKSAKDDAKLWIIVAVLAGVALAATEGARYDGWARLHPMHPVHLYGPGGEYAVMPLAHIDPETAAWSNRAVVVDREGPWQPLGRAPLNRVGFNYSMLMGVSEQPSADGASGRGFMSHIQFGYFPAQQTGILFDIGLGWRDNMFGDTLIDGRYSLELQFLPLDLGKLHLGVFGQVGSGVRLEDNIADGNKKGLLFGAGAMAQLELTTRLALTARAQATRFFDSTVSDLTFGISVY